MSASFTERLARFVREHAEAGDWPGGAFAVGSADAEPLTGAAGSLAVEPARVAARGDALYDLASLTKGLVTAPLALRLAMRGAVDPDAPLADALPEWSVTGRPVPTLAELLGHRAGLPAWAPLYRLAGTPGDVARIAAGMARDTDGGGGAVYSCLGPILAGIALERITGRPLRELFDEQIARPLGLEDGEAACSPLPEPLLSRVAPTERGRAYEARLARERAPGDETRGLELVPGTARCIHGEVHDGNAAFLGGFAGNAGLFATAAAAFRIAAALLVPGRLLDADAVARLAAARPGPGDVRTFGFQSGAAESAPAGAFGRASFGHVGFTGTSAWLDPESGRVAVLLTNRVHPAWRDAPMQAWRRRFHDLAAHGLGAIPCPAG